MAIIQGTAHGEQLFGTQGSDEIFALAGNDWVRAWGVTDDVTVRDPSVANHLTDQADTIHGGHGDDTLEGGGGDDVIYADEANGAGNDRIIGGTGRDTMRGGEGIDTFVFGRHHEDGFGHPYGASDAYGDLIQDFTVGLDKIDLSGYQNPNDTGYLWRETLPLDPSSTKLQIRWHYDYNDTVVEWAAPISLAGQPGQFMGATGNIRLTGSYGLDPEHFGIPAPLERSFASEHQAQAVRMYDTIFNRKAEWSGLDYWTAVLDAGIPLKAVADGFTHTPEFEARFGTPDNTRFVSLLYENVLDRAGEAEGMAFWSGILNSFQADRADIVVGFSESQEHIIRTPASDYLP